MRDFFECYLNLTELDIDNGCIDSLCLYFNGLNMSVEQFDQMMNRLDESNTNFCMIKAAADNIKRFIQIGNCLYYKSNFHLTFI